MSTMTDIHPNAVLESLLAKGGRSQRQGNLKRLHEICRIQHEGGSRDFSISTIGKLSEVEGILKGRALYNAPSADYRSLIEAWAAYAGPPTKKPPKTLASFDFLMRIEDPAIRSIMQAAIAERDKLKAQINTLKANTTITVDRRPLGATVVSGSSEPITVLTLAAQLTPSERESLQKAISPKFLADQDWREGPHGEILNNRDRVIFELGFVKAIRKILGE